MTDRIYFRQSRIIQSLAEQGPCVIVGRCANVLLNGKSDNVFVYAELSVRIQRKLSLGIGVSKEQMKRHILSIDKKRKDYCRHYTDQVWGMAGNYHLCVDTTALCTEDAAEVIRCYLQYFSGGEK